MSRALSVLLLAFPIYGQLVPDSAYKCHAHGGDDPQWAQPGYDDRSWLPVFVPNTALPTDRIFWFRCVVDLGAVKSSQPLYFQAVAPWSYRAYLDGQLLVSSSAGPSQLVRLPETKRRSSAVLAVRHIRSYHTGYTDDYEIGTMDALVGARAKRILDGLSAEWLPFAVSPVLLAAGLMLILLSGSDPRRRETLWFGILASSWALIILGVALGALELPGIGALTLSIWIAGNAALYLSEPRFFYSLRGKPLPRMFAIIPFVCAGWAATWRLSAISPVTFPLARVLESPAMYSFHLILLVLNASSAAAAFWPWWKIERRDWPVFGISLLLMSALVFILAAQLPFAPDLHTALPLSVQAMAGVLLFSMLMFAVLLSFRLQRVRREHDDLASEMQATQAIQRLLVPSELPHLPGFTIQSAFVPAKEVGGDFYQLLPQPDKSLLLVVGDVSGKGLQAAMLGSTIIGALSTLKNLEPSAVLQALNEALQDRVRGGFVTCCCALFRADGSVEIANAGHLLPYAAGEEIPVESGLPLGLDPDSQYETTTIVDGGRTLTFLSDGVPEARNGNRELLGFERLRALTVKPAREIAEAAESWGQQDDITVVQIAYA